MRNLLEEVIHLALVHGDGHVIRSHVLLPTLGLRGNIILPVMVLLFVSI
jgi:hypothetical protein